MAALMAAQSLLGLTLDHHYRDPDWIKATWFGNDWFTLLVAVPLLGISTACAARGSVRGLLLWLGTLVALCGIVLAVLWRLVRSAGADTVRWGRDAWK